MWSRLHRLTAPDAVPVMCQIEKVPDSYFAA